MSRICQITGKQPSVWNNVSHSQRKTKRRWIPNLILKKVFDKKLGRFVRVKISTTALKNLTKELVKNADKIYQDLKNKKN